VVGHQWLRPPTHQIPAFATQAAMDVLAGAAALTDICASGLMQVRPPRGVLVFVGLLRSGFVPMTVALGHLTPSAGSLLAIRNPSGPTLNLRSAVR